MLRIWRAALGRVADPESVHPAAVRLGLGFGLEGGFGQRRFRCRFTAFGQLDASLPPAQPETAVEALPDFDPLLGHARPAPPRSDTACGARRWCSHCADKHEIEVDPSGGH
jgi:hypothetical protein